MPTDLVSGVNLGHLCAHLVPAFPDFHLVKSEQWTNVTGLQDLEPCQKFYTAYLGPCPVLFSYIYFHLYHLYKWRESYLIFVLWFYLDWGY